jgi:hypothetical protein
VKVELSNTGGGSGAGVYALLERIDGDGQVTADSVYYGTVEGNPVEPGGSFAIDMGSSVAPAFRLTIRDVAGVLDRRVFDLRPPTTPGSLSAFGDEGSIRLIWAPSVDEDHEGYLVYRSTVQGGPYVRITPSPVRSSSMFADSGLLPLTRYYYAVAAQDSSGNVSALSEEVPVSTNPPSLAGWPQHMDIETAAGITLGDLDGDGDLEIVSAGGELYAYHHDGEEVVDGDDATITWIGRRYRAGLAGDLLGVHLVISSKRRQRR